MSADFNTEIDLKVKKEELELVTGLLRSYREKEKPVFFSKVKIISGDKETELESLDLEEDGIRGIIEAGESIKIKADGPYGKYHRIKEVELFERIADEIPNSSFQGTIEGYTGYTTESIEAVLENSTLSLTSFIEENDEKGEAYFKMLSAALPYERFVEVLKIDEEEFDEDDYDDFISESDCFDRFMRENHDEFLESCPASGITGDEYAELNKQFTAAGLNYEDFSDYEGGNTEKYTYDPFSHKYLS